MLFWKFSSSWICSFKLCVSYFDKIMRINSTYFFSLRQTFYYFLSMQRRLFHKSDIEKLVSFFKVEVWTFLSKQIMRNYILAIINVFAFPPSESFNSHVNLESRYGINTFFSASGSDDFASKKYFNLVFWAILCFLFIL